MLIQFIMCLCSTALSLRAHLVGLGLPPCLGVQTSISKQWELIKMALAKVIQTPRARLHRSVLLDFMGTNVFKYRKKKFRRKIYVMILGPEGCSSIQGESWRKEIQYWWNMRSHFKFLQTKIPFVTTSLPSAISALWR